jgi:hypothetical protein
MRMGGRTVAVLRTKDTKSPGASRPESRPVMTISLATFVPLGKQHNQNASKASATKPSSGLPKFQKDSIKHSCKVLNQLT